MRGRVAPHPGVFACVRNPSPRPEPGRGVPEGPASPVFPIRPRPSIQRETRPRGPGALRRATRDPRAFHEAAVLPRFFHLSAREAREMVAELAPREEAPARVVVTSVHTRSAPAPAVAFHTSEAARALPGWDDGRRAVSLDPQAPTSTPSPSPSATRGVCGATRRLELDHVAPPLPTPSEPGSGTWVAHRGRAAPSSSPARAEASRMAQRLTPTTGQARLRAVRAAKRRSGSSRTRITPGTSLAWRR